MSASRLGLSRRPFRPTPALDLYVPLSASELAITTVRAAFDHGEGLALLDGEPGTGKTITALKCLETLRELATPIYIVAARFARPAELLQAILFDLNQPYSGLSEQELRLAVTQQLLALKPRAVIVIDEAQLLAHDVLEEVRLLDNLESAGTKATFLLLVAQPSLREQLAKPYLAAIAQRMNCRCRLSLLQKTEASSLLREQLVRTNTTKLFSDEAIELLATHGGGVARVLNQYASQCLQLAASSSVEEVDVEIAYEVLSQAGVTIEEAEQSTKAPYSAGAARSTSGERGENREDREPRKASVPKQKARTRRAA
jgi:type II secretory pathway predicted ATPase ExeA